MKNYDKMFMDIAVITALQSNCVKYKVGCVLVRDNRVVLQGYNGTMPGFINCCDKFCDKFKDNYDREEHNKWSTSFEIHAEMNCITYAAKKGIKLEGLTMYSTLRPCNNCLKHIIQAGIKKVVYKHEYEDNNRQDDINELLKSIEIIILP